MIVPKKQDAEATAESRRRLWQQSKKRTGLSEEGRKWLEENAEAIESMNEWVEKNGLPLAKYRMF
jgi:antitoxin CcdA